MFYDPQKLVQKFHRATHAHQGLDELAVLDLRRTLIEEEFKEVIDALAEYESAVKNEELVASLFRNAGAVKAATQLARASTQLTKEKLAKEIADLHYVLHGTEDALDIPGKKVFKEVQRSNMSKLGPGGKPIFRQDGKVLKGPDYRPADIHGVLTGEWL